MRGQVGRVSAEGNGWKCNINPNIIFADPLELFMYNNAECTYCFAFFFLLPVGILLFLTYCNIQNLVYNVDMVEHTFPVWPISSLKEFLFQY